MELTDPTIAVSARTTLIWTRGYASREILASICASICLREGTFASVRGNKENLLTLLIRYANERPILNSIDERCDADIESTHAC